MLERFGERRVIDTPIAEMGFAGIGIGAAMVGLRPIIEFMTWNFSLVAFDQIVNNAAKICQMTGGQYQRPDRVPRPERPGGAGRLAALPGARDASTRTCPGLKVVMPSTPADAKGLLKTAIRDDNPVVFMEGETLYNTTGEVPDDEEYLIPLGKADIKREGKRRHAGRVVEDGVDLPRRRQGARRGRHRGRGRRPAHAAPARRRDARRRRVRKTDRCVIVEDGWPVAGFGAEIAYQMQRAVLRRARRADRARDAATTCRCRTRRTSRTRSSRRSKDVVAAVRRVALPGLKEAKLMAQIIGLPKLSPTMEEGVLVRWTKKEGDKVVARRPHRRGRDRQGEHGLQHRGRGRPAEAARQGGRHGQARRAGRDPRQGRRGRQRAGRAGDERRRPQRRAAAAGAAPRRRSPRSGRDQREPHRLPQTATPAHEAAAPRRAAPPRRPATAAPAPARRRQAARLAAREDARDRARHRSPHRRRAPARAAGSSSATCAPRPSRRRQRPRRGRRPGRGRADEPDDHARDAPRSRCATRARCRARRRRRLHRRPGVEHAQADRRAAHRGQARRPALLPDAARSTRRRCSRSAAGSTTCSATAARSASTTSIVKAVALALRRVPECNASWDGDAIRHYHRVHVGVAVAIEDGLVTPVVRDADQKGIGAIAAEVRDLAERAKQAQAQGATRSPARRSRCRTSACSASSSSPRSSTRPRPASSRSAPSSTRRSSQNGADRRRQADDA